MTRNGTLEECYTCMHGRGATVRRNRSLFNQTGLWLIVGPANIVSALHLLLLGNARCRQSTYMYDWEMQSSWRATIMIQACAASEMIDDILDKGNTA